MLTLIAVYRDTPVEGEQLLVFGVGNPIITPSVEEVVDEEGKVITQGQLATTFFKSLRNHLLRDTSATLSNTQLELLARKEMDE